MQELARQGGRPGGGGAERGASQLGLVADRALVVGGFGGDGGHASHQVIAGELAEVVDPQMGKPPMPEVSLNCMAKRGKRGEAARGSLQKGSPGAMIA